MLDQIDGLADRTMNLSRVLAVKIGKFGLFSGSVHQKITNLSFNEGFAFLDWA
jgi:hypothetical protein